MQPQSDDEEDGQQNPPPPSYPASGYTSASSFQPGFGFGAPSTSWLKARGIIKPQFRGGSGTVAGESIPEPMDVEPEESKGDHRDKRANLLKRFDRPEREQVVAEDVVEMREVEEEKVVRVAHTDERVREMWEGWMDVPADMMHAPVIPPRFSFPGLASAFLTRPSPDVFLVLDSGPPLPAHKSLLSARSSYFHQMFTSNFSETSTPSVHLHNFSPASVTALLEYCYTGKLRTTGEYILELLLLSQYCRVNGLKRLIEEYLGRIVDEDNVGALSAAALDCRAWQLREYCVKFVGNNQQKVARTGKELPRQIVVEVKKREELNLISPDNS